LGKGADLIIRIATQGAKLAQAQMTSLGKSSSIASNKLKTFAKVGGTVVAGALLAIGKGVVESVQAFTSFDDKLTQSLAIMETTTAQQEQMARVAREVATTTAISATDSAEAYFFLASAGLNAEQSISALPQVAKFAQAGMFDMATATDLATDAQSALGLTVNDATQNLMNLTRVTDVLVKANTLANATVQQFSEALTNKAGSALKVTNKDIEEGVAVLSAFADRGVKGAEAGEKLNQILRDVSRAVKKNNSEWVASGIVVTDAEGNLLHLSEVVANLTAGMDGLSDVQKAGLLDQLGLNRGVADAVKILAGAEAQIKNYDNELRNAGGTTERVAQKQLESFKQQTIILQNQLENLAITIGQDIVPTLLEMTKGLQTTVERMQNFRNRLNASESDMKKFKVGLSFIAGGLIALNPVVGGVALAIAGLAKLIGRGNDKYEEAKAKADALTGAYQRQAYYLGFVASETEEVVDASVSLEDILDGTNYTVDELTQQLNENGIALDENAKEALKTAEAYEQGLLGGLQSVVDALDQLEAQQDRVAKAESDRNKALNKQFKAEKEVQQATENLDKAKQNLATVQGLGAKVTAEEQLAIERQKLAIEELKEAGELTKIQKLELAVAEQQLSKLIEESTALSREEEQAIRNVEQAEKDLVRAEELKIKALEEVAEAQKSLNKVTEQSFKNTLQQAIAQEELTKALAGFGQGTKGYEDALKKMSSITGIEIDKLMAKYDELFAKSQRIGLSPSPASVSTTTSSSTDGSTGGSTGGTKFPAVPFVASSTDIGGGLAQRNLSGGQTLITVNTGSMLGTPAEIEEAVAKALQEGARRGINVVF
jgi:TP901 family phage tail tape measure protein